MIINFGHHTYKDRCCQIAVVKLHNEKDLLRRYIDMSFTGRFSMRPNKNSYGVLSTLAGSTHLAIHYESSNLSKDDKTTTYLTNKF
jgi:hypothetical protein